ncbi:MAG: nucleotide exchange factor GrpE, partial [Rudaea sp.]
MAEERIDSPDGQDQEVQSGAPSLEQQLEEERKKSAEYMDNWKRTAAEFANYRRRIDRDKSEYTQFANSVLLGKLLDVMDGFDAAFRAIPEKF